MDSADDTPYGVGCPIRRPRDRRALASPPGFSQRAASFIASQCQGIHQMPFFRFSRHAQRQTPRGPRLRRNLAGRVSAPAQAGGHALKRGKPSLGRHIVAKPRRSAVRPGNRFCYGHTTRFFTIVVNNAGPPRNGSRRQSRFLPPRRKNTEHRGRRSHRTCLFRSLISVGRMALGESGAVARRRGATAFRRWR
jgi:hypothetical protein